MEKEQLYKLGFTEKEAGVYLALNRLGPSVASTLSRIANIKRTSIYDVLSSLLKRNLIISYKQGPYTYFAIDDVNKLLYQERDRLKVAESLSKELKKLQEFGGGVQVNYYKGQEGYREMYEDILKSGVSEMLVWVNLDAFYAPIGEEQERKWVKERMQKKIFARLLAQKTPVAKEFEEKDKELYREIRFIPKESLFDTTCVVYGDYITFFDPTGDIEGVRLQNKKFADMFTKIFEMQWANIL